MADLLLQSLGLERDGTRLAPDESSFADLLVSAQPCWSGDIVTLKGIASPGDSLRSLTLRTV